MGYELREHTADVAVEATAPDRDTVFSDVADGLAAAMCTTVPDSGERFEVTVTAESLEALLFDYLDELIFQRDVRSVLPVDNRATVTKLADGEEDSAGDQWQLTGSARGVPLDEISAREVKAVTYSEMVLEPTDDGWHAYVVLDV